MLAAGGTSVEFIADEVLLGMTVEVAFAATVVAGTLIKSWLD